MENTIFYSAGDDLIRTVVHASPAVHRTVMRVIVVPDHLRVEANVFTQICRVVSGVVGRQEGVRPRAVVEFRLEPVDLLRHFTAPVHVSVKTARCRPIKTLEISHSEI